MKLQASSNARVVYIAWLKTASLLANPRVRRTRVDRAKGVEFIFFGSSNLKKGCVWTLFRV